MKKYVYSISTPNKYFPPSTPVHRGYYNIGRIDAVSPAEVGHLSNPNLSTRLPKHLHRCVKSEHFKMEGHYIVKALIRRNNWMVDVNLNDAFFMVSITIQL